MYGRRQLGKVLDSTMYYCHFESGPNLKNTAGYLHTIGNKERQPPADHISNKMNDDEPTMAGGLAWQLQFKLNKDEKNGEKYLVDAIIITSIVLLVQVQFQRADQPAAKGMSWDEYFDYWSEIHDIWNAQLFCFWTDFETIFFCWKLGPKGSCDKIFTPVDRYYKDKHPIPWLKQGWQLL